MAWILFKSTFVSVHKNCFLAEENPKLMDAGMIHSLHIVFDFFQPMGLSHSSVWPNKAGFFTPKLFEGICSTSTSVFHLVLNELP